MKTKVTTGTTKATELVKTSEGMKKMADTMADASIKSMISTSEALARLVESFEKVKALALDEDWGDAPTGDAAEMSVTNDRKDPRIPWIKFSRWSFSSFEDWKMICDIAGQDPTTTETVTIYVLDVNAEACPDGETISPSDEY